MRAMVYDPRAVPEFQALSPALQRKAISVLKSLQAGHWGDCEMLHGNQDGLYRRKSPPLRIIWAPGNDAIHVRAIRRRTEGTYRDSEELTIGPYVTNAEAQLAGLHVADTDPEDLDHTLEPDAPGSRDDGSH